MDTMLVTAPIVVITSEKLSNLQKRLPYGNIVSGNEYDTRSIRRNFCSSVNYYRTSDQRCLPHFRFHLVIS